MAKKLLAMVLVLALAGIAPATVTIDTVAVGNSGNAGDASAIAYLAGIGAVDYDYEIGRFEVSNLQYVEFLNAVASAEDTYGLYNDGMNPPAGYVNFECGIVKSGSPGSFSYSVVAGYEGLPVNYVGPAEGMRFANWLHNGQPVGGQDAGTTEDGSYLLNGATGWGTIGQTFRKPTATWVLPTAAEWYKAGHHQNNGVTGDYYNFATGTDAAPTGEQAPGGANSANYQWVYELAPSMYSPVGAYTATQNAYGLKDMVGNVKEWCETESSSLGFGTADYKVIIGAATSNGPPQADSSASGSGDLLWFDYAHDSYATGFRLAKVVPIPEPFTLTLLALGGLVLIRRKR